VLALHPATDVAALKKVSTKQQGCLRYSGAAAPAVKTKKPERMAPALDLV
jgi:hypothetical protein